MILKNYIEFINESRKIIIDDQGRRVYNGNLKVWKRQVVDGKLNLPNIDIVKGNLDLTATSYKLTSLEGCPSKVGGDFDCSRNKLTSLEGCPQEVGGDFECHWNQLTSLEGGPQKVGGWFDCSDNKLDLSIEEGFIESGSYKNDYWPDLLKYMINNNIPLEEVKGWPKGFLTDEVIRSAKGLKKFNI
jgi:hypothetical protein